MRFSGITLAPRGSMWCAAYSFTREAKVMMSRSALVLVALTGLQTPLAAGSAPPATEAPAGFDTPTLVQNPGSRSSSNGIAEPPGDTFGLDQQIYETLHDVNTGLGPVY